MMDDNAADFRIDWLLDDDGPERKAVDLFADPDYCASYARAKAEHYGTHHETVTGPDACRVCNGEGHIVEADEPYPGRELIPCFACAGSGGRTSITPEVAEYTGQMLYQMLGRVT